jgi:hypothetical protein
VPHLVYFQGGIVAMVAVFAALLQVEAVPASDVLKRPVFVWH